MILAGASGAWTVRGEAIGVTGMLAALVDTAALANQIAVASPVTRVSTSMVPIVVGLVPLALSARAANQAATDAAASTAS